MALGSNHFAPGAVVIPITSSVLFGGMELEALRALIEALPPDAKLHRIYEDPCDSIINLIITSRAFPPHSESAPLPQLKVEFTRQADGTITAELISLGSNGIDRAISHLYKRKLTDI